MFPNLVSGMARYLAIQAIAKAGLEGHKSLFGLFRYAKIKGNTLFFVFKHPGAKMEFRYTKETILSRMREYYKANKDVMSANGIIFQSIQAAVILEKEQPITQSNSNPKIGERSQGAFTNQCKDPVLHRIFEDIRAIIKARR